jgi:hypothetical protein
MKLSKFNEKTVRMLGSIIAFKWIKVDKIRSAHLDIYLPQNITDNMGQGRLGHKYTCEALAVGPKVTQVKPGDRFMLHEYDKLDQGDQWDETQVMFCEEKAVPYIVPKETETIIMAKKITDKMMDEYENL